MELYIKGTYPTKKRAPRYLYESTYLEQIGTDQQQEQRFDVDELLPIHQQAHRLLES